LTFTTLELKIKAYMDAHPAAENPMDWHAALGIDRIEEIVDKANGRLILFEPNSMVGGVAYRYIDELHQG
jgi:hypothetical protein